VEILRLSDYQLGIVRGLVEGREWGRYREQDERERVRERV
jgi:hypothetical protein